MVTFIKRFVITLGLILCITPISTIAKSITDTNTKNDINSSKTCLGQSAISAAKAFFEQHRDFHYENPTKIVDLITPKFYAALSTEYQCTKNGEICAIDADPWIAAQDGDISKPITFRLSSATTTTAIVRMNYIFSLSKTERTPQHVVFYLERKNQNACWLITDLITPQGKSLVKSIEDWHSTHGTAAVHQR